MESVIPVNVTPHSAAKLVILNEIMLTDNWGKERSLEVINAIYSLSIEELLSLIDSQAICHISSDGIPQFGSIDALSRVPAIILDAGYAGLNYAQLGFKLKNDIYAKMDANIKFGENHGKGASLLGLININKKRFEPSSLTIGFCSLQQKEVQETILLHLFFRIPIIQAMLKDAKQKKVNGYSYMLLMKESTRKRRGQCLRAIFRGLGSLNVPQLSERVHNVYWEVNE